MCTLDYALYVLENQYVKVTNSVEHILCIIPFDNCARNVYNETRAEGGKLWGALDND